MIIPRNMRIDFAGAPLLWSRNKSFATTINAGSASAVAFEGYLVKVMARARDELGGRDAEVAREIDLFIAQEGHHYRLHKAYNKHLYAAYPKARHHEAELADALRHKLETGSLADNLAFSVGFENFACYMAKYQFADGLRHFEGADRRMATLWLWHAAEEFEHRAACNAAFNAISGNYFMRIRGLFAFLRLIMAWQAKLVGYMLEVDRATMSEAERAESIRLKKQCDREIFGYVLLRMGRIMQPFYDPRRLKTPRNLQDALNEFEAVALRPEPLGA